METFHYKLKFGDFEVDASGSEKYIREIKAFAQDTLSTLLLTGKTLGALAPSQIESHSDVKEVRAPKKEVTNPSGSEKPQSIAEFLEHLPSKTHGQKIMAFAYFLEKVRGLPSFGVKEINDCYDDVKEAKSNTAQYLPFLINSGMIMKTKTVGTGGAIQYVLTRTAEKKIKEELGSQS